jgi:hypothetical protein
MVGMAVATERVVQHHHVRAELPQKGHQPADRLIEVGTPERRRVGVALGTHHSGVDVTQQPRWPGSEQAQRRLQLRPADLGEPRPNGFHVHVPDLTTLAAGAGHHGRAQPLRGVARQHTAGADRLVVGMSVHAQQSQWLVHGLLLPSKRRAAL